MVDVKITIKIETREALEKAIPDMVDVLDKVVYPKNKDEVSLNFNKALAIAYIEAITEYHKNTKEDEQNVKNNDQ